MFNPILATTFGATALGGNGVDFTNLSNQGKNYGGNAMTFVIIAFAVAFVAGLVIVVGGQRGKTEILNHIAGGAIVAVVIAGFITWATSQSSAVLM